MHCNVQAMPPKQTISLNNCTISDDRAICTVCSYHDSQPSTVAFQRIGIVMHRQVMISHDSQTKNAPQCNPQMHTVQEVILVLIESQNVMFIG